MAIDNAPLSSVSSHATVETFSALASFGQQRLWFIDRFQPGLAVYNIPAAWRVRGELRVSALQRALNDIVARHEILRTTFAIDDGTPMQIVAARAPLLLAVETLPPCENIDEQVAAMALDEAETPFDLATGPLLRARLVRIADDDHLLMLTMHHAISDLGSLGVVADELRALYAAHLNGSPARLPDLPIQYVDFSAWQRDRLQGEAHERLLRYWRTYLDGAPDTLALPADRVRPRVPSFRGDWVGIEFDSRQSEALRRLSQRCGTTLFMTVAALFDVLLYRCSGQSDFLVGYPATGRDRSELEGLIGLLVNTLVMRARLQSHMTFVEVARRLKEDVLDAHAHRELPFEMLIEALQPDRDPSRHPLFQAAFAFVDADDGQFRLPGLELSPVHTVRRTSKFDLTLFFSQGRDGLLGGGFEYSTDLFERATIQALAERLKRLVDAVIAAPDMPIARLEILPDQERYKLVHAWNPPLRAAPSEWVHHRVERHARERPDAIAIRFADTCMTYAALDARAEALARRLRAKGADRGTTVGLCVERSAEMVVGMLAILKAGAAYVPFEPHLPAARLAYMAEDIGVAAVMTTHRWMQAFAAARSPLLVMDREEEVAPPLSAARSVHAHDLAYCIYTSGSSGEPKAVAISHGALSSLISWHHECYASRPSDRWAQFASLGFDACTWEIWVCLSAGAMLVIGDDETRSDPARLLALLARHQVTHAFLPTPLAEVVLANRASLPPGLALQTLLTGGDRLHHAPDHGVPFEVVNHYGPTEATVVATAGKVEPDAVGLPTIGRPISTAQVYILDPFGEPAPTGAPGELYVGGAGIALGYWRRPKLTAECFLPDPFSGIPGARLFRTGDAARYRANGSIEFLGRLDRQIKVRGYRIEPGEIEITLGRHATVSRCAVEWLDISPGNPRLIAFVESDVHTDEGVPLWRRHLEQSLPHYMLPEVFVTVVRLPLLPSGKLDRDALSRMARAPSAPEEDLVAPRNALEQQLAAIWSELLGVEHVGVHDNFFKLGGQSLLVIQLVGRVRALLGVELKVRDVFEHPTVARLHDCIARQQGPEDPGDEDEREVGEI